MILDTAPIPNVAIALDYLGIGALLLWSGRRLQRPAAQRFNWVLAAFILSCATGHGMEAVGSRWAHPWHWVTAAISTTALVILFRGQEQITKLAAADFLNERILSIHPQPVGLYEMVGDDDMLILYQNPAAIASLGADYTGKLIGNVMPAHREITPYSDVPLLEVYLGVAKNGTEAELDLYYPGDGPDNEAEGWYRVRCYPAGPGQMLLTWQNATQERLAIKAKLFANEIRQAIIAREFVLHYQPVVSLATGETYGYEALIRWPRDGRIRQPGEFLPYIEGSDIMPELCYLVIELACAQLKAWAADPSTANLHLAINMHPFTVGQESFERDFHGIVGKAGINRQLLILEITEQALIESPIIPRLHRLRWAGHPLSIDDYGTGFSSLAAIASYPATGIKLDRSIVAGIAKDKGRQAILQFILDVSRLKSWTVVSEGVETAEDAEYLRAAGVGFAQGYLFGRPGPLQ